jgi:hypothetical protein
VKPTKWTINYDETPRLDLPDGIRITISCEESCQVSSHMDIFRFTLNNLGEDYTQLESYIPSWVKQCVLNVILTDTGTKYQP